MNTAKIVSRLFGLLGALLLASAVMLSFAAQDAPARLLWASKDGIRRSGEYMDALCRMDLEALSDMTAGNPGYLAGEETGSDLEEYLWEAYAKSISYEFSGDCYGSDSGIARDVQVTVLDITAVLQELKLRSQDLLAEEAAVTDGDIVFDGNGQYRADFAMGVLRKGVQAILEEKSFTKTVELTLDLSCRDGVWYVQPSQAITNILTGSMGK